MTNVFERSNLSFSFDEDLLVLINRLHKHVVLRRQTIANELHSMLHLHTVKEAGEISIWPITASAQRLIATTNFSSQMRLAKTFVESDSIPSFD